MSLSICSDKNKSFIDWYFVSQVRGGREGEVTINTQRKRKYLTIYLG